MARTWCPALCAGTEQILFIRRIESDAVAHVPTESPTPMPAPLPTWTPDPRTPSCCRRRCPRHRRCSAPTPTRAHCLYRLCSSPRSWSTTPRGINFGPWSKRVHRPICRRPCRSHAGDRRRLTVTPSPSVSPDHRQPISIADHRDADHSISVGIADDRKSNARADTGTDPVAHDFCQTDLCSSPGAVSGAIDLATAKPNPNRLADIDAIALLSRHPRRAFRQHPRRRPVRRQLRRRRRRRRIAEALAAAKMRRLPGTQCEDTEITITFRPMRASRLNEDIKIELAGFTRGNCENQRGQIKTSAASCYTQALNGRLPSRARCGTSSATHSSNCFR